jgi:hypothetical protein
MLFVQELKYPLNFLTLINFFKKYRKTQFLVPFTKSATLKKKEAWLTFKHSIAKYKVSTRSIFEGFEKLITVTLSFLKRERECGFANVSDRSLFLAVPEHSTFLAVSVRFMTVSEFFWP